MNVLFWGIYICTGYKWRQFFSALFSATSYHQFFGSTPFKFTW